MFTNGIIKAGNYFIDEQYSYRTANSKERMDFYDLEYSWVPAEVLRDYVTVQKNERFSYNIPYNNAANDFHPPLYFYLLHTVCSFFPDQYSKWFPLGINMVFYILTVFALFLLAECVFKSKLKALLSTGIWAFSLGAVSTFLLARMYMVLTAFTVFSLYFTVKYYLGKNKLYLLGILISFCLAGLTHYYFWILGFFIVLVFLLFSKKEIKTWLSFGITVLLSFGLDCLLFPKTILQFTNRRYGNFRLDEAIANLPHLLDFRKIFDGFLLHFKGDFLPINLRMRAVFLIIILFILPFFFKCLRNYRNYLRLDEDHCCEPNRIKFLIKILKETVNSVKMLFLTRDKPEKRSFLMITVSILLCAYVILAIQPFNTDRYVFFLFPAVSMIITVMLSFVYSKVKPWHSLSKFFFTVCLLVVIFANQPYLKQSWYVYEGGGKYEELNETLKDAHVFYVMGTEGFQRHNMSYSFGLIKEILFTKAYQAGGNYRKVILEQMQNHIPMGEKVIVLHQQDPDGNDILLDKDIHFVFLLARQGFEINPLYRNIGVQSSYNVYEIRCKADGQKLSEYTDIYQYLSGLIADSQSDKCYSVFIAVKDEAAVSLNDHCCPV
jgi:hypothetical protein